MSKAQASSSTFEAHPPVQLRKNLRLDPLGYQSMDTVHQIYQGIVAMNLPT